MVHVMGAINAFEFLIFFIISLVLIKELDFYIASRCISHGIAAVILLGITPFFNDGAKLVAVYIICCTVHASISIYSNKEKVSKSFLCSFSDFLISVLDLLTDILTIIFLFNV